MHMHKCLGLACMWTEVVHAGLFMHMIARNNPIKPLHIGINAVVGSSWFQVCETLMLILNYSCKLQESHNQICSGRSSWHGLVVGLSVLGVVLLFMQASKSLIK